MRHPYPNGTRVYHYGHQYPKARQFGTATIDHPIINGKHIEYRVIRDDDPDPQPGTIWSAYHTYPAKEQG